jgi:hypothetical protein
MRVDIDKARQDRKTATIDLDCITVISRPSRADRGDRVPVDRQIDITTIAMGLRRGSSQATIQAALRTIFRGWAGSSGSGMASHRIRVRYAAQIPVTGVEPV